MSYRNVIFERNIVIKHIREVNNYTDDQHLQDISYYALFEVEENGWEKEIARADNLCNLLKNC